jgi:hypothetical protein
MSKIVDEQRKWLSSQLEKFGHGAKGELAKALGIPASAISLMINRNPERPASFLRAISFEELRKMGEFFGDTPPGMTGPEIGAGTRRILKTSKPKLFVREWRVFMVGDNIASVAKAASVSLADYQACETYPANFTIGEISAIAEELQLRPDLFWIPPPTLPVSKPPKPENKRKVR